MIKIAQTKQLRKLKLPMKRMYLKLQMKRILLNIPIARRNGRDAENMRKPEKLNIQKLENLLIAIMSQRSLMSLCSLKTVC